MFKKRFVNERSSVACGGRFVLKKEYIFVDV